MQFAVQVQAANAGQLKCIDGPATAHGPQFTTSTN